MVVTDVGAIGDAGAGWLTSLSALTGGAPDLSPAVGTDWAGASGLAASFG